MAHTLYCKRWIDAHPRGTHDTQIVPNGAGWLFLVCWSCGLVAELESVSDKGQVDVIFRPLETTPKETLADMINVAVRKALAGPAAGPPP